MVRTFQYYADAWCFALLLSWVLAFCGGRRLVLPRERGSGDLSLSLCDVRMRRWGGIRAIVIVVFVPESDVYSLSSRGCPLCL